MIESQTHDSAGEVCRCGETGQDEGEARAEDRFIAGKR